MTELTEKVRATRALWRGCDCPTHRAVHELVAHAEDLETQLRAATPAPQSGVEGVDSPGAVRAGLIELRDRALEQYAFSESVLLSHAIVWLYTLEVRDEQAAAEAQG